MTRLTATVTMLVCCAGAAFAQTEGKSCCAEKAKAEAVVQTVAQTEKAEKGCCAEKVAQAQAAGQTKDCCAEKLAAPAAQTVAMQTAEKAGSCCPEKGAEGAAQQVALAAEGKSCQTQCSEAGQVIGSCSTGAAALVDLPAMQRKVGDEVVGCPVKAGELAQASGQPVMFLVGQQTFADEAVASRAYAAELTSYLDKATRVTFSVDGECVACPEAASQACSEGKAMKYRVAGRDFESAEAAVRAAAIAWAASRQVQMNYAVNGECAGSCPETAKAKSVASAQPVVYRVGDRETKCDVQASVMLAIARIEAAATAVQALPQS